MNSEMTSKCPMAKIERSSERVTDYIRKRLKNKYGEARPKRAFHPKSIGLVHAKIVVGDLDPVLQQGLFKKPRIYDAWIRFSNASPTIGKDGGNQSRGMAIKIVGLKEYNFCAAEPECRCQDIILSTSNHFTPGTADHALGGVKVALGNVVEKIISIFPIIFRFGYRVITFFNSFIETPNVLEETYFSGTPYGFGSDTIKWSARPLKTMTSVMPRYSRVHYLRERLIYDLSPKGKQDISFGLFVQFAPETDSARYIEDSSLVWDTDFHQVAVINIPRQKIDTSERMELDEMTSFSPGNAIVEHAPKGSINLLRSRVYSQLAKERLSIR